MNCQTFEPSVNDLARGQMMEAALRESALAHAENCARCAARLADEQALNAGLRAYASSVETLEAPAPLETALRAAFRQRHAQEAAPAPVVAIASARKQHWMAWATAAAAAVVTVLALQAFRLRESNTPLHRAGNGKTATLSSMNTNALVPVGETLKDVPVVPTEVVNAVARQPRATINVRNRSTLAAKYASQSKPSRAESVEKAAQAEQEVVTDFMPLTYGAALGPNEGGQLVRVELPRSALVSLGLPMNADKSDERVKADVFLGHDGLARAIRFVR